MDTLTASAQWSVLTAALEWGQHRRMALCSDASLQPKVHTEKLAMTCTQNLQLVPLYISSNTYLQQEALRDNAGDTARSIEV